MLGARASRAAPAPAASSSSRAAAAAPAPAVTTTTTTTQQRRQRRPADAAADASPIPPPTTAAPPPPPPPAVRRPPPQQQQRHPASRAIARASHWSHVERAYHDFFRRTPEQEDALAALRQQQGQQQQSSENPPSPPPPPPSWAWAADSALDAVDVSAAAARLAQLARARAPDASDRPELFKFAAALHEHLAALAEMACEEEEDEEDEGGGDEKKRRGAASPPPPPPSLDARGCANGLWAVAALHRACPHASSGLPAVALRLARAATRRMPRMRPGEAAMAAWAVGSLYGRGGNGGNGGGAGAPAFSPSAAAPSPSAAAAARPVLRDFFAALERRLGGSPGAGRRILSPGEAANCLWARAAAAPAAAAAVLSAAAAPAAAVSPTASAAAPPNFPPSPTRGWALAMLRCAPPELCAPRDLVTCLWALAALGPSVASAPAARRWARSAHAALLPVASSSEGGGGAAEEGGDEARSHLTAHDVASLLVAWAPPARPPPAQRLRPLGGGLAGAGAAAAAAAATLAPVSALPAPPTALVAAVARRALAVLPQAPRALCPAVCAAGRWAHARAREERRAGARGGRSGGSGSETDADDAASYDSRHPLSAAWGEQLLSRAAAVAALRVGAAPSAAGESARAAHALARLAGGPRGVAGLAWGLARLGSRPPAADLGFLCAAALAAGEMPVPGGGGGGAAAAFLARGLVAGARAPPSVAAAPESARPAGAAPPPSRALPPPAPAADAPPLPLRAYQGRELVMLVWSVARLGATTAGASGASGAAVPRAFAEAALLATGARMSSPSPSPSPSGAAADGAPPPPAPDVVSPREILAVAAAAARLLRLQERARGGRSLDEEDEEDEEAAKGPPPPPLLLPADWLAALMATAPRFAAAASASEVAALVVALARLSRASGTRFSVLPRWSAAWARAAEARAPAMTPRQARRALAACRQLGVWLERGGRAHRALARRAAADGLGGRRARRVRRADVGVSAPPLPYY